MDRSFRSAPPILAVVDRVIDDLGHEALGLPRRPNPHESHHATRPGSVTLWLPFSEESEADEDAGDEGWISDSVRRYAARLARQVRTWLANPFFLESRGRPLRPEDILILVRRRGELAALIVARLHAEGVPVAGVDRLLLSAPLAVQDLLAAARFAAQPLDDLNLAGLLVSPLIGWSQDQLFEAAFGREGPLWPHIRGRAPEGLHEILAMADYATPHGFFETILSGPLDGRRKLLRRLGAEARDPIEELLSSALEFESSQGASLQAFLDREEHWRLLYVALTRAEERAYVGGALGVRDRGQPAEASWYRALQTALSGLGADWADEPLWGRAMRFGDLEMPAKAKPPAIREQALLPDWLRRAAPAEERPPRPLAPSSLGEEDVADPPPGPELRQAALRGRLLHALFERLPGAPAADRPALADRWLEHSAGIDDAALRSSLAQDACRIIDHPDFAGLFGPEALAEAPIAAVIPGGAVIAGTVDRLLVADGRILIADFKTGRRAPAGVADIPAAHLRQMAAYRAALRVIFPGRTIEAALLYTAAPVLHALPDALLDTHAPAGG